MTSDQRTTHSRIRGLRAQLPSSRLMQVTEASGLATGDLEALSDKPSLPLAIADGMIENVVGTFELPLGVATNFQINGKDYLIPMAVEEPSVVAAASYMARIVRDNGGFKTTSDEPIMRAQIQILGLKDLDVAIQSIEQHEGHIIDLANSKDRLLLELGGGCKELDLHRFPETEIGPMLVVHLLVNVQDAMGANTVNTMAETVAPYIEEITGGDVRLRILSNLADRRTAKAEVCVAPSTLSTDQFDGTRVASGIVEAGVFASVDPYRAATHNKGIMNGIDPVVMATGNDWRAIEAGAHAWAARKGRYTSLSNWSLDKHGNLIGVLEMPMALGLVGGATKTHPAAQAALKLLNVNTAQELGEVICAVGLAQNMAALRALSTEGIQRGHMTLHARNIAISAGATPDQVDALAKALVQSNNVTADHAKKLLADM